MKTPQRERALKEYLLYIETEKKSQFKPRPYPMNIASLEWMVNEILDYWGGEDKRKPLITVLATRPCDPSDHQYSMFGYVGLDGQVNTQEKCVKCGDIRHGQKEQ